MPWFSACAYLIMLVQLGMLANISLTPNTQRYKICLLFPLTSHLHVSAEQTQNLVQIRTDIQALVDNWVFDLSVASMN